MYHNVYIIHQDPFSVITAFDVPWFVFKSFTYGFWMEFTMAFTCVLEVPLQMTK